MFVCRHIYKWYTILIELIIEKDGFTFVLIRHTRLILNIFQRFICVFICQWDETIQNMKWVLVKHIFKCSYVLKQTFYLVIIKFRFLFCLKEWTYIFLEVKSIYGVSDPFSFFINVRYYLLKCIDFLGSCQFLVFCLSSTKMVSCKRNKIWNGINVTRWNSFFKYLTQLYFFFCFILYTIVLKSLILFLKMTSCTSRNALEINVFFSFF